MTHLLIAANELRDDHIARIAEALAGWGTLERIGQETPPEAYAAKLKAADIVFGWPPPAAVLDSSVRLLQLPSVGYDNYLGQGLEHKADSEIMTRAAIENAITVDMAIGGSTNAVIHLLALAGRLGIELNLDDFDRISRRTPMLANITAS